MTNPAAPAAALAVRDLAVEYRTRAGTIRAVAGVSFSVADGETLGIVGESGCGKSSLARAILQLPPPAGGTVMLRGTELTGLRGAGLRAVRADIQMVLQDPVSSLNPRRTVRAAVTEPLIVHGGYTREQRAERVDAMLREVGLDPQVYGDRHPSELSGGQCQRVSIARALVGGARLLICDEPVASLDVSLRAAVLNLLADTSDRFGLTVVFISHDLSVVGAVCDRVMVLYLGTIVEEAPTAELYAAPRHPYTDILLRSVPQPDPALPVPRDLVSGEVPSLLSLPPGCRFASRCPRAAERCVQEEPELRDLGGRRVACHFPLGTEP